VLDTILGRELIPVLARSRRLTRRLVQCQCRHFAGAIAGALKAKRFLLLTDVPGVLDKSKNLIDELSAGDVRKLIADGNISGGMIPRSRPASTRWSRASRASSSSTASAARGAARTVHRPRRGTLIHR